ncbi:MAG: helix-hairpin-helix domain-containing protein [Desulfobacterales bacterium]|jgi:ERCC4-type nuclease|nr:helix-hairpin-helix domain-containing protein [Desulfobacterales bacterium]
MNDNPRRISIIADDREPNDVINHLTERPDVDIIFKRLPIGDYLADNHLLFERKTIHDFAISIIDGRLFKQASCLAGSRHKGILILEGTSKDLSETGIQRPALQGALVSVSLIFGIPVLRSMHPSETADLICYAARQIQSIVYDTCQKRIGYRPKTKHARQKYILQGLPGVGPKRAKLLLERFSSVERVMAASVEDLQTVDGIGKDIAEKIKWAVNEQISAYEADIFFDV